MARFKWDYFTNVPEHTQEALERYFIYGLEPGGFLQAVLCNNLTSAVLRADPANKLALSNIVGWLVDNAPRNSWGNVDFYKDWIDKGPVFQNFQKSLTWQILNTDHTEMKDYDN